MTGPRQCGKSSLCRHAAGSNAVFLSFDDLALRNQAQRDPALFLEQYRGDLILDEVQYAPNLFPEIKRQIDEARWNQLEHGKPTNAREIWMTGSDRLLLDASVRESLAGRSRYLELNTLSVTELRQADPNASSDLFRVMFRGGWPALWQDPAIDVRAYLNDYIHQFVTRDVGTTLGVTKMEAFLTVVRLLAARTGQLLHFQSIANDAGVAVNTVRDWISALETVGLVFRIRPYHSNLTSHLTKQPKLYFWDTGLALRLQGYENPETMMANPQLGALFETLVAAELMKFRSAMPKPFDLFLWRTKEKEEIDFVLRFHDVTLLLDAKLAIHGAEPFVPSPLVRKALGESAIQAVVTFGGSRTLLSRTCWQVPIAELRAWLTEMAAIRA
jgi:predicted AAA+ superfamily ATPase